MSDPCKWLHEQLQELPMMTHPFDMECLPQNGIYFFYEHGETWGHTGNEPRIVRVGSHTGQDNLRTRISETYLLDESRLLSNADRPKPADRSIFRKNLGRALLNRRRDEYLQVWQIDFTLRSNREQLGHLRDIAKERWLESEISRLLRERFSFRAIAVDDGTDRTHLEKHLIGTVANCRSCSPSRNWLGRHSPETKIAGGNLWEVQHLTARPIGARDQEAILRAIQMTKEQLVACTARQGH